MRFKPLFLLAFGLFAQAAAADAPAEARDAFRAEVRAQDRAGVLAALDAAEALDATGDPWHVRNLYATFADMEPGVDAFTAAWAEAAPRDARALAARGWFLWRQGWVWRGGEYAERTWPEKLQRAQDLHLQAMQLMQRAYALQPDFLPASDGILQLARNTGAQDDLVPVVLQAVMASRPNHQSLMLAMPGLARQWGGAPEAVGAFCDAYAPLIHADPPYTPATCRIEAVYSYFSNGPERTAARLALAADDSPYLDGLRRQELMTGALPQDQAIAALERIRATRPLDRDEAELWDQLHTPPGEILQSVAYPQAVRDAVAQHRRWAINVPLDPTTFDQLWGDLHEDERVNNAPYPADEMIARAKAILAVFPQDPMTLSHLGDDTVLYGGPGLSALDRIVAAEPYFEASIVYSLHDAARLRVAMKPKLNLLLADENRMHPTADDQLPPRMRAALEDALICPALRQVKLLQAVCLRDGADYCLPRQLHDPSALEMLLRRGSACPAALTDDVETLIYLPG